MLKHLKEYYPLYTFFLIIILLFVYCIFSEKNRINKSLYLNATQLSDISLEGKITDLNDQHQGTIVINLPENKYVVFVNNQMNYILDKDKEYKVKLILKLYKKVLVFSSETRYYYLIDVIFYPDEDNKLYYIYLKKDLVVKEENKFIFYKLYQYQCDNYIIKIDKYLNSKIDK